MFPRYSCAISATPCPSSSMRACGGDGSDFAIRVAASVGVLPFGGKYSNYNGGDVVITAVYVRSLDECIDDPLGLGAGEQQLLDSPVVDHARQAIAGEEERISHAGFAIE